MFQEPLPLDRMTPPVTSNVTNNLIGAISMVGLEQNDVSFQVMWPTLEIGEPIL